MFGWFSWAKIGAALGVIAGALLVALKIRQSGADAERRKSLEHGLDAIGKANDAASKLDPSQEAIDNDPNNLDRPSR